MALRSRHSLPGFGLSAGITLTLLCLMVLAPVAVLSLKGAHFDGWGALLTDPRVLAAVRLSFGGALLAALIDAIAGLLIAWVLVRYHFPGRKVLDSLIDLPFALPTAVAGIALATLYAPNGWLGSLSMQIGWQIAYTPWGVLVAMCFIGLPFVVRSVQPVLADLSLDVEEAALTLGASPWQTFRLIILPAVFPSLLTGVSLAFARAVGEYGSVIFIAGNLPGESEIVPLLIVAKLEQYDTVGATALAVLMLGTSFAMLFILNGLQVWQRRNRGTA